jgi:hypothetical protein
MRRVIFFIATTLLCLGLVALLILKPWKAEVETPRFVDRLPVADIIGRTNILNLAKDFIPATYYNQIPYREFITPDFILSQGKINGLNLQRPVYFFGNQSFETGDQVFGNKDVNEWGVMFHVSDSSKLYSAIKRFEKMTVVKDSLLFNHRIFISPEYNLTVSYGRDWLLVTDRRSFKKYLDHVVHARIKSIYPRWREFIGEKVFKDKSLRVSIISKQLRKYGVSAALLASSLDSTSFTFHTRLKNIDTIPFTLKPNGERFERTEFTRRLINLHLNIDRLKDEKSHPLYGLLKKVSRKVSFPLDEFLDTWDGDITFRQGGLQTVVEPYIESELDENFNVTEVVKYKRIKISGFALKMSMNDKRPEFIKSLYSKGILTQEENKVRLLYFPPMRMKAEEGSVNFYTSSFHPATIPDSSQTVLWDYNYTPVLFTLDSIQTKNAYGKINIGLKKLVRDQFHEK